MDSQPFFSVCIPNFNYAHYIRETIESVLRQTFSDFEVIIVDNASTDGSWDVIREYVCADKRVKAHRNNYNIGFAPNLQRATEKASGKFLILLSSDDIMFPTALEDYFRIISSLGEPLDNLVVHSAFDTIDSGGRYISSGFNRKGEFKITYRTSSEPVTPDEEFFFQDPLMAVKFALETNFGIAAFLTTCYSRHLWHAVEGYDTQYQIFPDKAFLFKILLRSPKYVYVNKALFGYRIHQNNQNAKNSHSATLKHQVDGYLRTVSLSENDLKKLGVSRKDVQRFYLKNLCEKHAFIAFNGNQRMKAFKILCFSLATFPLVAVKLRNLWGLAFLLLAGPVGPVLFRRVYALRRLHPSMELERDKV